MRERIQIEISSNSRLALGQGNSSFVPGRALRGALAESILTNQSHDCQSIDDGCDFCTLFLGGQAAIFRNAYPRENSSSAIPTPLTVTSCIWEPDHKLVDTLFDRTVQSLSGVCDDFRCHCGGRLVRSGSEFVDITPDGLLRFDHSPLNSASTHAAVNHHNGCAEGSYKVFALESGGSAHHFAGSIECPAPLSASLVRLLAASVRWLGGSTSRGFGSISVQSVAQDPRPAVSERLAAWNERLAAWMSSDSYSAPVSRREPWASINHDGLAERLRSGKEGFFVIDLRSDAILPEIIATGSGRITSGRYHHVLSAEALNYWGDCDLDAQLLASYAQPSSVTGWSNAWKLPKAPAAASARGGVFLFYTKQLDAWLTVLDQLEKSGIGERQAEGFGEIDVCSAVHQA